MLVVSHARTGVIEFLLFLVRSVFVSVPGTSKKFRFLARSYLAQTQNPNRRETAKIQNTVDK